MNDYGIAVTKSGAGVLPARFGYDTSGTGELTSLETYSSGSLGAPNTGAKTTWSYDQATGLLQSKTFADGSQDVYKYDLSGQLSSLSEPNLAATFGYNAAGEQTSATYTDANSGVASTQVLALDDTGRGHIATETDNGRTFTETMTYTPLDQLQGVIFGSAANASVGYSYFQPNDNAGGDASGNLKTLTLTLANSQTAQQTYGYAAGSKYLSSITVNGHTYTFSSIGPDPRLPPLFLRGPSCPLAGGRFFRSRSWTIEFFSFADNPRSSFFVAGGYI